MEVATARPGTTTAGDGRGHPVARGTRQPPRWRLKKVNRDLLRAATIATAWSWEASATLAETGVEEEAENLRRAMTAICDVCMPRVAPGTTRNRAVYWWNAEIAGLRGRCAHARKRYQRLQRRRRAGEKELSRRYVMYRELLRALQKEIKAAKDRAWLVWSTRSRPTLGVDRTRS
jgi:hypothetical protein